MMHTLEKLAEEMRKTACKWTGTITAECIAACADDLDGALASLWRPFDPDDEGTWPEEKGKRYDCISDTGERNILEWDDRANLQLWANLGVTHYTELLPGPR